ncbi:hypothetical protein CLV71_106195 [Actinophytocola oryzae]|uniref:Uncharacterized protein n=1 Tax=Actinophytocola oryzae TaxID=502181 RepID=A0A4V3FTC8_9PSEU|nr:hypothetical protein CLV71_106195 [Actinophytocola oryzae]
MGVPCSRGELTRFAVSSSCWGAEPPKPPTVRFVADPAWLLWVFAARGLLCGFGVGSLWVFFFLLTLCSWVGGLCFVVFVTLRLSSCRSVSLVVLLGGCSVGTGVWGVTPGTRPAVGVLVPHPGGSDVPVLSGLRGGGWGLVCCASRFSGLGFALFLPRVPVRRVSGRLSLVVAGLAALLSGWLPLRLPSWGSCLLAGCCLVLGSSLLLGWGHPLGWVQPLFGCFEVVLWGRGSGWGC